MSDIKGPEVSDTIICPTKIMLCKIATSVPTPLICFDSTPFFFLNDPLPWYWARIRNGTVQAVAYIIPLVKLTKITVNFSGQMARKTIPKENTTIPPM